MKGRDRHIVSVCVKMCKKKRGGGGGSETGLFDGIMR